VGRRCGWTSRRACVRGSEEIRGEGEADRASPRRRGNDADEAGPQDRERMGRARGKPALIDRPHRVEGERERVSAGLGWR
jgi:hypothetical protein